MIASGPGSEGTAMRSLQRFVVIAALGVGLASCETAATESADASKAGAEPAAAAPAAATERVAPPFDGLRTNEAVVERIKEAEGLRLEAYRGGDRWLIGYGHTGDDVTEGLRITAEKADEMLRADLLVIENEIKGLVTAPLNQNEFSALVDLVYNIGSGNFRTSTVLSALNAGDRQAAADAFLLWDKVTVNGQRVVSAPLAARRQFERAMFLGASGVAAQSGAEG